MHSEGRRGQKFPTHGSSAEDGKGHPAALQAATTMPTTPHKQWGTVLLRQPLGPLQAGDRRLLLATAGYRRLQLATAGYRRLQLATVDHSWLPPATAGYGRLQLATAGCHMAHKGPPLRTIR